MSIWLTNPQVWKQLPLGEQLRRLRRHYCTGPCGQSSSVLMTRSAASLALQEAIRQVEQLAVLQSATRKVIGAELAPFTAAETELLQALKAPAGN